MADIDANGMVTHPNVQPMRFTYIERGPLTRIEGIIVHQTGSPDEKGVFAKYRQSGAAGAHFLIGKNGAIWQTASLHHRTNHVGRLKPRCVAEMACSPAQLTTLRSATPEVSNRIEMTKSVPQRYPSNIDSVGIEIVGNARLPPGKSVPPGLSDRDRGFFLGEHAVYEPVTPAQQVSLQWLIDFLRQHLYIPTTEVHRHPDVSWKNPTEASTARWK